MQNTENIEKSNQEFEAKIKAIFEQFKTELQAEILKIIHDHR